MKKTSKTTQPETETKTAKTKTSKAKTTAVAPPPVETKVAQTKAAKTKTTTATDVSDASDTPKPVGRRQVKAAAKKAESAPVAEPETPEQATPTVEPENAAQAAETDQNDPVEPVIEYDADAGAPTDDVPVIERDEPTETEIADKTFGELKTPDPMTDPVGAMQAVIAEDEAQDGDDEIKIQIDGEVVTTTKSAYVKAKTKDLIEFGYSTLTETETAAQVDKILSRKFDELDVIGQIMKDDFVFDADEFAEMPDPTTGLVSGFPPAYREKDGKIVAIKHESPAPAHAFVYDEDFDAENAAQSAATALIESENLLDAVVKTADAQIEFRELTAREKEKLAYAERQIENALKSYVSIGKWLFFIYSENLFVEFGSWSAYVRDKWKMKNVTGSHDLMKAFRTWRLASSGEGMTIAQAVAPERWLVGAPSDASDTVHDGEIVDSPTDVCVCGDQFGDHSEDKKGRLSCKNCACSEYSHDADATQAAPKSKKADAKPKVEPVKSDADAPSQRAIEELSKLTGKLEREELSETDFAEFEAAAVRWLYQGLRETVGDKEITQKTIAEAMDAFVEFAKAKAFEIDGEHYSPETVNAADFRITRGLFEGLQREREGIREMLDARRKRMSAPQERASSEYSFVPPTDENGEQLSETNELYTECRGKNGHGVQAVHVFMFGAVQLKCGCVFGKPKGQDKVLFNPKLTKDNPLTDEAAA